MEKKITGGLLAVKDVIDAELIIEEKARDRANDRGEHQVWAEPQLFLVPFCLPQKSDRLKPVEIVERVKVDGVIKERRFCVNPDPRYGLPGAFELEVMLVIYQLAAHQLSETTDNEYEIDLGSIRNLLKLMGRPYSGKYSAMVKEALKRLASTVCISEGFFYSKPKNLYLIKRFGFITEACIAGEDDGNGNCFERTTVKLDPVIVENLQARFRTLVDARYIRELKTDIAKTLTFHLSYRFHLAGKQRHSYWDADYSWLAPRLGIRVYDEQWEANKQMKSALEELKRTGFLENYEWLQNMRLRFHAGPIYLEQHKRRVENRDAFLSHQEEIAPKQLSLLPALGVTKEPFDNDPLPPVCAAYALKGWTAEIQVKAERLGLDQAKLHNVALARGFKLKF